MSMTVSSDPNAFLRPIYHRLVADRAFHLLAEQHQFDRLIEATAEVSQKHASLMRRYNAETRRAILGHLSKAESLRPGPTQVELWRLRKGDRELVCVTAYIPTGVDLRVCEAGDMRRTQLLKDGPAAEALAGEWPAKALAAGWAAI